jgi:predicted nucleotidyltransferase
MISCPDLSPISRPTPEKSRPSSKGFPALDESAVAEMNVLDIASRVGAVLAADPGIQVAWLFGSRARGDAREASDVDLAVLVDAPPSLRSELRLRSRITAALEIGDVDLVILNLAPPLLRFEVIRDGRRLFARDPDDADRFEERVIREYHDTAWLRKVQYAIARDSLSR